ncbi:MAG: C40 family peptidase, partial [Desulfomicrobium sp.]|nr:C40 family peptidase [Desulfomicrobium sp.]
MAFNLPVLVFLLFVAAGCASKTVIQTPVAPPPQDAVHAPSVSELLLSQYQAWKGVRHRVGGSDRKGVDCSGLVQIVFRDAFRMDLPRTSRDQIRMGRMVDAREMRPGDLVY